MTYNDIMSKSEYIFTFYRESNIILSDTCMVDFLYDVMIYIQKNFSKIHFDKFMDELYIDVVLGNRKNNIMVDKMYFKRNINSLILVSDYYHINMSDVMSFFSLSETKYYTNSSNPHKLTVLSALFKLHSDISKSEFTNKSVSDNKIKSNIKSVSDNKLVSDNKIEPSKQQTDDFLNLIKNATNNLTKESLFKSINSIVSENQSDTALENQSDSENQSNIVPENQSDQSLLSEIEKLENIKKDIDKVLEEQTLNINTDKEELINYSSEVQKETYESNRTTEYKNQHKNIFISEKSYTYPKIYDLFFVKHKIKTWNDVPPLFLIKFPIYLFLDGKNTNGEDVYEKILDTEKDFEIYTMLYDALTDENFEIPDDELIEKLIMTFLETFPPIPIITNKDLMLTLNSTDQSDDHAMFREDETLGDQDDQGD
jgi:hypothetical protein